MSVIRCSRCGRDHYKYPGAPFSPFCSLQCREDRMRRKKPTAPPGNPREILGVIRQHNRIAHQAADLTYWNPACERCEMLQERYAEALREAV